jgi:uncharacterized protein
MILQSNNSNYTYLPEIGILVNSEIEDEFQTLIPNSLEIDEKKFIENLRAEITDEEIERNVNKCRNLTLNITEECNFKCKYCAYSGLYESNRVHNSKSMDLNTAKKAVDLFLKTLGNKHREVRYNTVYIGFYGGEALLEFNLIKNIVKYAKAKAAQNGLDKLYNIEFRLSTNGYLLNKIEIVNFLVNNNIGIDVSLDGPQKEHDKFRITSNNEKSWEVIWDNLSNFYTKFPDYYSQKITFLATLHPFHNFERIDRFFLDNPEFIDIQRLTVNYVRRTFLKESLRKKWFSDSSIQPSQLVNIKRNARLKTKFSLRKVSWDSKFTAMCFPGEIKFFVSSNGKIYICERVKNDMPIGNVNNGLDFNAIRKIQRLWNEEIIRNRCWECPAVSLCNVCVAQSEDKEGIRIDCNYKERFQDSLTAYLSYKEEEYRKKNKVPEEAENNIREYFRQL